MATQDAGLVDARLAKALSHPMRARILAILNQQVASPNEISEMIDERLPNVSYHVRALQDLGCIELVRTAQRRGAIEHYYRALKRPFFSDRDWKRLPASARQAIADGALQRTWEDISDAIAGGTLQSRSDSRVSYNDLVLDDEGWAELSAAVKRLLDDASKVASKSSKRLAKSGETGISSRLVILSFEAAETPTER